MFHRSLFCHRTVLDQISIAHIIAYLSEPLPVFHQSYSFTTKTRFLNCQGTNFYHFKSDINKNITKKKSINYATTKVEITSYNLTFKDIYKSSSIL